MSDVSRVTSHARLPEPRGVDSDRVDSSRRLWRVTLSNLVLGVLLGALIGGLYGVTRPTSHEATTALSVLPDSAITTSTSTSGNAPSQDATSYIQSQLVILNGDQLAAQVQQKLSLSARPNVSSTQVGQTYVVRVTAAASKAQQAAAIASTLGTAYTKLRVRQLTSEVTASLTATDNQLAAVRASLTSDRRGKSKSQTSSNLTPAETALQTEYERLLSVRSGLAMTQSLADGVVTVLTPASVSSQGVSGTVKYLLGGALLGALAGLAGLIVVRRLIPRVRNVGDLAALDVQVLLPVLARRPLRVRRNPASRPSSTARLLAARVDTNSPGQRRAFVVFGATPKVGASFVAASIASALADRGPVLLVSAGSDAEASGDSPTHEPPFPSGNPSADGSATVRRATPTPTPGVWVLPADGSLARTPVGRGAARTTALSNTIRRAMTDGWLVVVDAPALSASDVALHCLEAGGIGALVVGRGRTTPADVLGAIELLYARGARVAGAVLNDVPGRVQLLTDRVRSALASRTSKQPRVLWDHVAAAPRRPQPRQDEPRPGSMSNEPGPARDHKPVHRMELADQPRSSDHDVDHDHDHDHDHDVDRKRRLALTEAGRSRWR